MTVFLGDIAFYLGILVFAVGVYMIHHSCHRDAEKKSKFLCTGGYIVTVISILGMLCTGYYWMKYYFAGSYENSSPHAMMGNMMSGMMGNKGMGMNSNMMRQKMNQCLFQIAKDAKMNERMREKMRNCMMDQAPVQDRDPEKNQEENDSHH